MENIHYNLLEKPWIPVEGKDGKVSMRGIKEVIARAHEFVLIVEPSPLLEFGLYRFLVAFVMDAYTIKDTEDITDLLATGSFDQKELDGYIDKWHDRFDLFDEKHPFYQAPVACPDRDDPKKRKSPAQLFQHIPTGTNVIHFFHVTEGEHVVSLAAAARALCAIPAFMTAGGAGFSPSINVEPPLYVLIKGENLFQTLVLNSCGIPIEENGGSGPVAWRADNVGTREEIDATSLLQGLTWQPRHVHLIPGKGGRCTYTGEQEDVLVHEVVFDPGWKARCEWRDPNVAYRITKDGRSPLRAQEGKDIWRDTGPLLLLQEHQYRSLDKNPVSYEKPIVVKQFVDLKINRVLSKSTSLAVNVYGIRTDGKMKIYDWQKVSLSLPADIVINPTAGESMQENMERADGVSRMFYAAMKMAYPRDGEGNDKANENLIKIVQRKFWNALEPRYNVDFVAFLQGLAPNDPDFKTKAQRVWSDKVKPIAKELIDQALDPLDATADEIRRVINARNMFIYKLKQILDPAAVTASGASKPKPERRKTAKEAE
ncbi:MAG: type I-E CRISPR-associated protein Cse1/CasA [Candidatus Sigynarchaeota archaeon]